MVTDAMVEALKDKAVANGAMSLHDGSDDHL